MSIETIPTDEIQEWIKRELIESMDIAVSSNDPNLVLQALSKFKILDDFRKNAELNINLNLKTYRKLMNLHGKSRHVFDVKMRDGIDLLESLREAKKEFPIDELNEIRRYPEIRKEQVLELCFERFGTIKSFVVDAVVPRNTESEYGNNNGAYIRLREIGHDEGGFERDVIEGVVIYRKIPNDKD